MVLLRQKFLVLSKKYHPDFFVNEREEMKLEVLSQSTLNNDAFKTLSNDVLRIGYVLELLGVKAENEKEILPHDFLMEMMDLNEEIMELKNENRDDIKSRVLLLESSLQTDLKQSCTSFDLYGDIAELQKVKTIYLKQKYLLRIKESMLKFASL